MTVFQLLLLNGTLLSVCVIIAYLITPKNIKKIKASSTNRA